MKKSIFLILLVLAVSASAKSQAPCKDCPPNQRDYTEFKAARAAEVNAHNEWPARPKLSTFPGHAQFAQFKAEFKVTNEAAKKIKEITWECSLINPATKETIANYTLVSRKSIAPHNQATLSERVIVPLKSFYEAKVVSANNPSKPKALPELVQAEQLNQIKEIKYADGSVVHP